MLFAIFIHDPVTNDTNELCMGITATAETSDVSFIGCLPLKTYLEGGDYYVDKLLF